jgi:acyl dehydratase
VSRADLDFAAEAKLPALTAADLEVGTTYETGEVTLEPEDVTTFARSFDPQPMHLDDTAAAGTLFGRRVVSGWHVLALTMRLIVDSHPLGATPIIGVELARIRFRKPVLPGTKLRARAHLAGVEPAVRAERAIATFIVETLDANTGDVLIEQHWKLLLPACPDHRTAAPR